MDVEHEIEDNATEALPESEEHKPILEEKYLSEDDVPLEKTEMPIQKPALTINIQSWATPVVGLLMLVLGLLGGFYGRPLWVGEKAVPGTPQASGETSSTNPQPNPDSAENREAFVTEVVSRVRHFRGDPNAPITFIEFSDFQ